MSEDIYDVIIIGGGPAGLSCALYSARGKLSTLVLDRAPGAGALAYAAKIANYPGIGDAVPGLQILDAIREQAVSFGAHYRKATVVGVNLEPDPKIVYTSDRSYTGISVMIATGSRGRRERIDGEEEFLGRGVSYCATCDAPFYRERVAGVVGYDEVAVEESLFLARFAEQVHIVCPNSTLSAPTSMLEEVADTLNLTTHLASRAVRIVGDDVVTGLVVRHRDESESTLPLDGVFMLLAGAAPITGFLADAVKLDKDGCVIVDCNHNTSIPGVFAAGDVTCLHPKQAIIAAGEGVIAALSIDHYLSGRERSRVDYV